MIIKNSGIRVGERVKFDRFIKQEGFDRLTSFEKIGRVTEINTVDNKLNIIKSIKVEDDELNVYILSPEYVRKT